MPPLTAAEIMLILNALAHQYGSGYSKDAEVGRLQAKLSIQLEVRRRLEAEEKGPN